MNNSPLYQLPNEILEKILNYVDVESMRSGGLLTCRKFNEIMTVSREFSKKLRLLVYYADNEMPLRKSPLNDLDYCMALLESNLKFESVTVSNITSHNEMIHVLLMLQKFSDTIKELEVKDCTSLGIMEFTKLFRLLPNLEVVTLNEIDLEFFDDGDDISYTRPALLKLRELKITESSDEVLEIFLVCQVEKFQTDLICRGWFIHFFCCFFPTYFPYLKLK